MNAQREYIEHFRQEADAIVEQQMAELQTSRYPDDMAPAITSRASGEHLQALERELQHKMEDIVKEAAPDQDPGGLKSELMTFYKSYIEDFIKRLPK